MYLFTAGVLDEVPQVQCAGLVADNQGSLVGMQADTVDGSIGLK